MVSGEVADRNGKMASKERKRERMKRELSVGIAGIIGVTLAALSPVRAELVREANHVGTNIDLGQIVSGDIYAGPVREGRVENQTITRTGVYLTEAGTYNERLAIKLTIGGLFWWPIPETNQFQTRLIKFGPGVGQAQGVYSFGEDLENPAAKLQFGLFPHKYSEAVNLGEYLYRSGTYPGTLVSGGWSYINAASYLAQGLRLTVPTLGGSLTHDFTLYMERDLQPAHDLSPSYTATFKPGKFFEISSGVVWSHAISLNSDRLAPERDENAYNTVTGKPITGAIDSITMNTTPEQKAYYTFKGFKFMARASVGAGDFRLYSELALLGIENQPYFYENRTERMPIMLGLNLPTFGLLDRLTGEIEYRKARFANSNYSPLQIQSPIPVDPAKSYNLDESGAPINGGLYPVETDWKWTIYAKRKFTDGVSVVGQVASDHLRHFEFTAMPAAVSATPDPNDWYYVLRLEIGI